MNFIITKQKTETVTESIDIKTPSYYSFANVIFYAVLGARVIVLTSGSIYITEVGSEFFQRQLTEAIGNPQCSVQEFDQAYRAALKNITEGYSQWANECLGTTVGEPIS